METEPLRADRDDRGCGASDAGWLHGWEGEQHLCRLLLVRYRDDQIGLGNGAAG